MGLQVFAFSLCNGRSGSSSTFQFSYYFSLFLSGNVLHYFTYTLELTAEASQLSDENRVG